MSKLDRALHFTIEVHKGMVRKGDNSPYVLHPMEAVVLASAMTNDEDVLCAAALHDVVEDTPFSLEDIKERFGERVAKLVDAESENKRSHLPSSQTWLIRKQESLKELQRANDEGVFIVWLADKLANLRSLARLKDAEGNAVWRHFHQSDPEMHEWYYREIADATKSLSEHRLWQEFSWLIDDVFGGSEQ